MSENNPVPVDPRGLRLSAGLTSVVLVLALLTAGWAPALAVTLVAVQTIVFAVGAILGMRYSPYGWLFARLVLPRLSPAELEDPRPPRFAQAVGLVFVLVALVGFGLDAPAVALVAIGLALVASLLNAVVGFCLGCEFYLLFRNFNTNTGGIT